MAYEKYIEKDGKIYGPYIYHSKRVGGKVVSEYYGSKKRNYKKILIVFSCIVFAVLLFFAFTKIPKNFTGRAVLSVEDTGSLASENIILSLKEGELIPAASKIVFESKGKNYEYPLSDFISESPLEGDYYIEGAGLSGSGEGYGVAGVKKIYPEVSFTLGIYDESDEKTSVPEQEETAETTSENFSEENITAEPEVVQEEVQTEANQTTVEEPEIQNEENPDDINAPEEITEITGESPEEASEESAPEPGQSEIIPEAESAAEETPTTITGNIVKGIFGSVYSFFLRLSPTGRVTEEFKGEISGSSSAVTEFVYQLEEGQSVKLIPGSVNVEGKTLPDDTVEVKIIAGKAVVLTDYSEEEEGFGEDYLGEDKKDFSISLLSLDKEISGDGLKIKLISEEKEILTLDSQSEKTKTENINEEKNLSEPEIAEETEDEILNLLTDDEIIILTENFGNNFSVKTTSAEVFKNRVVVRHTLGEYWIEPSYDYGGSIDEALTEKIENDKIKWLKEIAKTLSETESVGSEIDELLVEKIFAGELDSESNTTG